MPDDIANADGQDRKRIKTPYELRNCAKNFGAEKSRIETGCYFPQRRRCESPRITQALRVAVLACLALSWAATQYSEARSSAVDETALEAPTTTADSTVDDMTVAPVIIEAERLHPDPSLDSVEHKLRDALGPPPVLIASERHFTDGATEVNTRFGRFCEKPVPGNVESPIGGSITLAARCASY